MSTNIFKTSTRIGAFSDGRERLFVEFSTAKGQPRGDMQWTPAWDDVSDLMVNAVEVERRNKPGSTYLDEFAKVCSDVVVKYAPARHVKVIYGHATEFRVDQEASKPYIDVIWREVTDRPGWIAGRDTWELSVPLDEERLKRLMEEDHRLLIWNDRVVDIGR